MNPRILRAEVLLAQGRFDLAEREVGQALAESPDDAFIHALLAVCLKGQHKYREAEDAARRAIGLDPGTAFPHYVLAACLAGQRRWAESEAAVRPAIDLDPSNADYFNLLAELRFNQEDWRGVLAAADQGLTLDAQHSGCLNARALALTKLGRTAEAAQTVEGVLADNPEDAYSHMTRGWTALHQAEPDKALEHFREALRIEPSLEPAREGMVLALKARYRVYRWILAFFLWMQTRGRRFQWAAVIAILVGQQVVGLVARESPELAPIAWPVFFLILGFGLLTWLADPLFNLVLRCSRFGRHALSADARGASTWVGVWLLLALVALVIHLAGGVFVAQFASFGYVLMAVGSAAVYRFGRGRPRWLAAGFVAVLLAAHTVSLWHFDAALTAAQRADATGKLVQHKAAAPNQKPVFEFVPHPDYVAEMHRHLDAAGECTHVFSYGMLGLLLVSQYVAGRR